MEKRRLAAAASGTERRERLGDVLPVVAVRSGGTVDGERLEVELDGTLDTRTDRHTPLPEHG